MYRTLSFTAESCDWSWGLFWNYFYILFSYQYTECYLTITLTDTMPCSGTVYCFEHCKEEIRPQLKYLCSLLGWLGKEYIICSTWNLLTTKFYSWKSWVTIIKTLKSTVFVHVVQLLINMRRHKITPILWKSFMGFSIFSSVTSSKLLFRHFSFFLYPQTSPNKNSETCFQREV